MLKPKILLIHGWNYANYTSFGCKDAWANRSKFVELLSHHFNVVAFNLPGFCGQKDPEKSWTLDNYVDYVNEIIQKQNPHYLLGYSFGGAIALRWKNKTKDKRIRVFLVSPAIIRRYKKIRQEHQFFQRITKHILPKKFIDILRDFYLISIVKNPYYSNATKVMRETYRNIVTVDLRKDLEKVSDQITIIYGENDTATPPELVKNILLGSVLGHRLLVVYGGGHDIANSHTESLVKFIMKVKEDDHEIEPTDFFTDCPGC